VAENLTPVKGTLGNLAQTDNGSPQKQIPSSQPNLRDDVDKEVA
jgi:hypothetical protein